MFDALSTQYLRDAQTHLRHPIPGDATFLATVANLLRVHIAEELANPDRVARDETDAKAAAEEERVRAIDQPGYDASQEQPAPKAKSKSKGEQASAW